MAEASIPVDLFNPGQVFACLGFMEAADVLLGDAEGGFDWSNEADVRFVLRANSEENPFAHVLAFLATAEVRWLSHSPDFRERDGGPTTIREGVCESSVPRAPDLPGELFRNKDSSEQCLSFGYWADGSSRFSTTFKKSTNGVSSHVRTTNAMTAIKKLDVNTIVKDPLSAAAATESLFKFDPRGDTSPIDAGTSLDALRKGGINVRARSYPVCELLAQLGLQHSRPSQRDKDAFRYFAWGKAEQAQGTTKMLPTILARAAVGTNILCLGSGNSQRSFLVCHAEVKSGGDRRITTVSEELIS